MKEIKYITKHNCRGIERQGNVAVDKCEVDGEIDWYLHLFWGKQRTREVGFNFALSIRWSEIGGLMKRNVFMMKL